jgi:hypothetical protein
MADGVFDNLTVNGNFRAVKGKITLNDNVGIGTDSPAQRALDVSGDIRAGRSSIIFTDPDHVLTAVGDTVGHASIQNAKNAQLAILGRMGPDNVRRVRVYDYLDVRGRMDTLGNVGIGIEEPKSMLHLNVPGSNQHISAMTIDVQSFGTINNAKDSHFLQIRDIGAAPPNGKTHFTIDGLGNVGIGTPNPSAKLEVDGDIRVTGDIFLTNADCAEEFDIADMESIEPGTVMVIDNEGALRASDQSYDRRVAGVISGAGDLRPGITLNRQDMRTNRLPLALTGKAYCKVDAEYSSIEVGDLLTTSSIIGHAMKVNDPLKAFGAVIGKALRPLKEGQGLIPILIALQ